MSKTTVIFLLLFISSCTIFREKEQFNNVVALIQAQGITAADGKAVIINNRACGTQYCGKQLYDLIESKFPSKQNEGSVIWLYSLEDSLLINSIGKVTHTNIKYVSRNEYVKYGVLNYKHAVVTIKNEKITKIEEFNSNYKYP
jgi:hypothetical protein